MFKTIFDCAYLDLSLIVLATLTGQDSKLITNYDGSVAAFKIKYLVLLILKCLVFNTYSVEIGFKLQSLKSDYWCKEEIAKFFD